MESLVCPQIDPARLCEELRTLVHDCLSKHMYDSAAFFAEKLVTLTPEAPEHVYLLAQTYYIGRNYRRALSLLKGTQLIESDPQVRYLAAKCLAEVREWEECLTLLEDWPGLDTHTREIQNPDYRPERMGSEVSFPAAMWLLRGKVYEAMENRGRAMRAYQAALRCDPFCYEAFHALVDRHMLTPGEERELRDSLHFRPEDTWLKLLYRAKCKKHDQAEVMQQTLELLEGPLAPAEAVREASQPMQTPPADIRGAGTPVEESTGVKTRSRRAAEKSQATPGEDTVMGGSSPERGSAAVRQQGGEAAGCGLGASLDVLICRADWEYHLCAPELAYNMTSEVLEMDPYCLEVMPLRLAAGVELGKKNELFLHSHKLVEEYPDRAISWYAVGCYYMCTRQYDSARRFFSKATGLDPGMAQAWVGFGNSFAAQDESDQAMAAYRTAARLFPGLHQPLLGMAMEYARMNNLALAEQLALEAHVRCPWDPLNCHELGVLAYKARKYEDAETWLQKALDSIPEGRMHRGWEPTWVNLGHVYRKQRRYNNAVVCYEKALGLRPGMPGTFAALGYTYHLQGLLELAISHYHKALGLRPEDTFTTEMLGQAVMEEARAGLPASMGIMDI